MTEAPASDEFPLSRAEQLSLPGLIEAANRLSNTGQPADARQLYQVWIDHNRSHPQLYVAYFNCAALAGEMHDQAAAAAYLKEAIALNSDFAPAYINLGRICEESGAADNAVELLRMAASRKAPINGSTVQYA